MQGILRAHLSVYPCARVYHTVESKAVDNAEQIRTVATRRFARDGFDGTSLQAIADEVGVTKQTLLYHYASKDALRQAVLDSLFAHWRERLPAILEAVTSGHGRFDALTAELIQFVQADRDRVRLLVRELLDNTVSMKALFAQNLRPWVLLVAQYIREGQRAGLIYDDVDPETYVLDVIALSVSAVAFEDLLEATAGGGPDSRTRWVRELTRLSRTALFKTPAPEDDGAITKRQRRTQK